MIHNTQLGSTGISLRIRLVFAALGASLLLVSAVAWRLTPDARGQGTHQQLGLPPCTFMMLFNTRCPACGMTTAWSHVVRGQLPSALRANVAGTLLAGLSLLLAPWLLATAIRGQWLWRKPSEGVLVAVTITLAAVTLVDWLTRLWMR